MKAEATRRLSATGRLTVVNALGVDGHVWSHTGPPGSVMVTGIVDHARDAHGMVHASCWTSFRAGQGKRKPKTVG